MAILRLRGGRETPLFSAFVSPPQGETIVSGDGDVTHCSRRRFRTSRSIGIATATIPSPGTTIARPRV
jgi:hypothetical protein